MLIDRHTHLEGALDPDWVRRECARRGQVPPLALEQLWRGEAVPFEGFIEAFLFGSRLLDSEAAILEAVRAVTRRTAGAGGGGFDLWLSPGFLVSHLRQISLEALWRGIEAGFAEARAQGVAGCVVLDAVNHLGPANGEALLDLVAADLPPFVAGFSTGGLERVPFRDWAPVFHRARKLGLRVAAHAGENGPGAHVREAVLEGGVERIVHGLRADAATFEFLAERGIPVDVCPASNRALASDVDPHPLPRMLRAGVRCALGTDDPGLIPCDLATERRTAAAMGLSPEELQQLQTFGAEDAWCLRIQPSPERGPEQEGSRPQVQ